MGNLRVLVCGGRDYTDRDRVYRELDAVRRRRNDITVLEGGAFGADYYARGWCMSGGALCETYEADWQAHGRAAGPIRNQEMLDEGKPDLVIAFPGGRGTADMIRRARAAGVEVVEVKE